MNGEMAEQDYETSEEAEARLSLDVVIGTSHFDDRDKPTIARQIAAVTSALDLTITTSYDSEHPYGR